MELRDTVAEAQQECRTNYMLNLAYSPSFLEYLKIHILPYIPIMTHVMVDIRQDHHDRHTFDTQNPVEKWHDAIKNRFHCKDMKLSRYIDRDRQLILGVYLSLFTLNDS